MDDEVENTGKVTCKYIARMIVSVATMFLLLWTIYIGYDFVTKPHRDGKYKRYALSIGAATIVLGITFVTIGLAIVADLVLNLTSRLQPEEKRIEIQQGKPIQILIATLPFLFLDHQDLYRYTSKIIVQCII